jgi:DNA polymerase
MATMADDRSEAMKAIAAEVRGCTLCDLHLSRTKAVPGAGNIQADIMFIGEGPGFHEDRQGLPFVGRSGDYLNELLKMINLDRNAVFIRTSSSAAHRKTAIRCRWRSKPASPISTNRST